MLLAIWYDLLQHKCTGWHYKTLGQQLWEQPPTQGSLAKLLSDVTQQCHHKPTLHKLSPYTLPTMARPNTTHHHHNLATAPSYRTSYATGQRHFLTFCCTIKVSPLPASKWQQHYLQQCMLSHKLAPFSIKVYISAISLLHCREGLQSPTTHSTWDSKTTQPMENKTIHCRQCSTTCNTASSGEGTTVTCSVQQ